RRQKPLERHLQVFSRLTAQLDLVVHVFGGPAIGVRLLLLFRRRWRSRNLRALPRSLLYRPRRDPFFFLCFLSQLSVCREKPPVSYRKRFLFPFTHSPIPSAKFIS